jgi:hypothetical protein
MMSSKLRVHPQTLWYFIWSAMFLISAGNALTPHPIFSGKVGLISSALLAAMAGIQMRLGVKFRRRKEAALSAVLLIIFCTAQLLQYVRSISPPSPIRGVDFSAYYLAGKLISETPAQNLYQLPLFADGRMNLNVEASMSSAWHAAAIRYKVPFAAPFIYPPFFAVLLKPLSYLSFYSAFAAWNMFTALLAVGAVLISLSVGGVRPDGKLALVLGVGLFSYYPLLDNLFFGQSGGLILFLLAAGVWLLSRNRPWLSALSFALATMIKLTPVLAVPVLIFHRRWKWLVAYGAWMISLLIFSVWQGGWIAHQQFWREVLPSISNGAPICQNLSIMAFMQELFLGYVPLAQSPPLTIPPYAGAVSRLVAFSVYLLMLGRFYLRRRDGDLVRDLVIMTLLGIVVSPISWTHHYTIALLPFLYLWCNMPEKGNRMLLVLFIAVGTNVVGIFRIPVTNHIVQLILAAIIPGLTIALAYVALAPRRKQSAGSRVFETEVGAIAHSQS